MTKCPTSFTEEFRQLNIDRQNGNAVAVRLRFEWRNRWKKPGKASK